MQPTGAAGDQGTSQAGQADQPDRGDGVANGGALSRNVMAVQNKEKVPKVAAPRIRVTGTARWLPTAWNTDRSSAGYDMAGRAGRVGMARAKMTARTQAMTAAST